MVDDLFGLNSPVKNELCGNRQKKKEEIKFICCGRAAEMVNGS